MITACCDIGNTRVKVGIFKDDVLEQFLPFEGLKETIRFLRPIKPDAVVISSVVPKRSSAVIDFCNYELGMDTFLIDHSKKFYLSLEYDTPLTLGIDRLCTSEAAFKLFTDERELKKNEIIITADLGTAVTINIVKYPHTFSGGLIAPGPGLLFKAMKLYTAQLPDASGDDYIGLIGKDTKSCIASGVINSIAGLINRVYINLSEEHKIVKVYVTGGNAVKYKEYLNFEYEYKPELLILGMKIIFDHNR